MVFTAAAHLINMFCNMVPCSVTQPPPQAFIRDNYNWASISTTTPTPFYYPTISYIPKNSSSGSAPQEELEFNFNSDELALSARSKRLLGGHPRHHRGRSKPQNQASRQSRMTVTTTPAAIARRSRTDQLQQGQSSSGRGLNSVLPSIFSAVPVIPVLFNNLNGLMRSMTNTIESSVVRGDGIGDRSGRSGSGSGYEPPPPLVSTQYGDLEGYFMGTMKGRRISAFEGVPYAEPPLGKYRFRPPVPKFPWKSIYPAKKTGSSCSQAHPLDFFMVTGSEDCLFLNVYTPQIRQGSTSPKLPILFLIHGGSFQYGSSAEYGPTYLLDEEVILVTANYRLGPLGFLSTGDEQSPGNYGLKDQALALKWVYENIEEFGGDKDRITIMGQSAGGVSAHLHLIANKTTPYFQSGVSLSGSAFGFWPIVEKKRSQELGRKLASAVNCRRSNSREMMRCLRSVNPHVITAAQMQLYEWIPFHPLVLFAPVIEDETPDAFLTRRPEQAYQAGEVMSKPWIFGQTSQEGHFDIYFMRLMMQAPSIALNGRRYLPIILDYGRTTRQPRTGEITDKLLQFYGGALIGRGINMHSISDMYTDRFYTSTIRKAIKSHSAIAPDSTYAYVFDYKGKYNLGSLFGSPESEWGVSHTEDMFFYFNSSVYHHGLQRDDNEYGLSQIMTDFLANFISTGTPMHMNANNSAVPFWDPVNPSTSTSEPLQYLRIRKELSMMDDPFSQRVQFWESLGLD